MQEKYDVIIVGMGPSSIFCAYELIQLKKYNKILLSFFVLCILISTILNFILHANLKSLYY